MEVSLEGKIHVTSNFLAKNPGLQRESRVLSDSSDRSIGELYEVNVDEILVQNGKFLLLSQEMFEKLKEFARISLSDENIMKLKRGQVKLLEDITEGKLPSGIGIIS